ncbi:MAG: LysM peptidoglycan-binding domain-containing protein [Planctomycetota bacterium]
MTREHKLALILGFSLVLVVGVLISDHLSRARTDRLDATGLNQPIALEADNTSGARLLGLEPVAEEPARETYRPAGTIDASTLAQGTPEPFEMRLSPSESSSREPGSADRSLWNQVADAGRRVGTMIENGAVPAATKIAPSRSSQDDMQPVEEPSTRPVAPRPAGATVVVRHNTRPGDSLFSLARLYYNDPSRWTEIRDRNRDRLSADGVLRQGVRLDIPSVPVHRAADVAEQIGRDVIAQADRSTPRSKDGSRDTAKVGERPTTYTVAKGDTLGLISQKTLGSVRYMQKLLKANSDKIKDPNEIRVGMVLTIPQGE